MKFLIFVKIERIVCLVDKFFPLPLDFYFLFIYFLFLFMYLFILFIIFFS